MIQDDLMWVMGYYSYDYCETYVLGAFDSEEVALGLMDPDNAEEAYGEGEYWMYPVMLNVLSGSPNDPLIDLEDRLAVFECVDDDDFEEDEEEEPIRPHLTMIKGGKYDK